jgi:hypothetical protein
MRRLAWKKRQMNPDLIKKSMTGKYRIQQRVSTTKLTKKREKRMRMSTWTQSKPMKVKKMLTFMVKPLTRTNWKIMKMKVIPRRKDNLNNNIGLLRIGEITISRLDRITTMKEKTSSTINLTTSERLNSKTKKKLQSLNRKQICRSKSKNTKTILWEKKTGFFEEK